MLCLHVPLDCRLQCTCISNMLRTLQPANVSVDVGWFYWRFPGSQFALHQPVPSVLCSGGQWQCSYGCISLTYFPSADWWVLTERMPLSCTLSHADPLSTVVFLIPVDRKLFLLPPFPVCPWQAYFLPVFAGLCMCVWACVRTCLSLWPRMCVCMYVWVLQWSRSCFYVSAKRREWFR